METTMNGVVGSGLSVPGVKQVFGIARASVQLGLGLTAMAFDMAQGIGAEAIRRGAEIEKDGMERASAVEREAVGAMKGYLRAKSEEKKAADAGLEAKIEQALATFDVPTRDDIRELHMHLAAVSEKLNNLQHN